MRRILSVFMVGMAWVLWQGSVCEAEVFPANRTGVVDATNDNLLISRSLPSSPRNDSFKKQMKDAGWDTSNPFNHRFYNVRNIIQRQDVLSLEEEINAKLYQARRQKALIESCA